MKVMSKLDWRATDPAERYRTLVDQTMTMSVVGPPDDDASNALEGVAEVDGGNGAAAGAVPVVSPPATAGAQTSYGLPDVTLSDPVMLGSTVRLAVAGMCGFALLASIGAVIALAAGGTHGAAPYAVLGVLAGLALLAMVVLVMGFKSVAIRSGP